MILNIRNRFVIVALLIGLLAATYIPQATLSKPDIYRAEPACC